MKRIKVVAVASGGGHWEQLMTMRPAFEDVEAFYVTTLAGLPEKFGLSKFSIVPDCNRNEWIKSVGCALSVARILLKQRPQVVISTGALPGFLALAVGRIIGAHTIWIDSLANVEEMSMSGRYARRFANHWLTQWPDVAKATGARYIGRVL